MDGKRYSMYTVKKGKVTFLISSEELDTHPVIRELNRVARAFLPIAKSIHVSEEGKLITTAIGKGVSSVVYQIDGTTYAIKSFHSQTTFIRELTFYRYINACFPNPEQYGLPKLFGYIDGYLFLRRYDREMTLKDAHQIQGVCRAVYNLHMIGIVHRDIKFSNIMIHHDAPIIVDFTLSSWYYFDQCRLRDSSIQTMWYRAPEVAIDELKVFRHGFPMDVWSIGIIREATLTGSIRWKYDNPKSMVRAMADTYGLSVSKFTEIVKNGSACYIGNPFMEVNPKKRITLATFLKTSELGPTWILANAPIAKIRKRISKDDLAVVLLSADNLIHWAAMVAMVESGLRADNAVYLSRIIVMNENPDEMKADLTHADMRLTTVHMMLLEHPEQIMTWAPYCAVFSIGGNIDHLSQVTWIKQYMKGVYPDNESMTWEFFRRVEHVTDDMVGFIDDLATVSLRNYRQNM